MKDKAKLAPKIQAAMRRELERMAKADNQQRGMFFDTSGKLRCERVSASSTFSWIFKTQAGKPYFWKQPQDVS